jgi:hypothetical protein
MSIINPMRDNVWLLSRLDEIWSKYFADITQVNRVFIKFGRYAKLRLGSIKQSKHTKNSYIVITSMFKKESIPVDVVDHTIAHELVHYTHGFSSSRPRAHKYPHSGGVVKKEMEDRGMGNLHKAYRAWVKSYRHNLKQNYGY